MAASPDRRGRLQARPQPEAPDPAAEVRSSRGAHVLAVVTVGATLFLMYVGGVVTNTGSALAVPDWPTTYGHNMFTYPWSQMVGGIFYEHSHRLLGSLVGMLTVALALWIALGDPRRWMRWLGLAAVIAVIVQGILGGLRVVLLEHGFALIHACLAHAFLSLMVALAVFTSKGWQEGAHAPLAAGSRLPQRAVVTAAVLYLQIVFGALLTHAGTPFDVHLIGAGLAAVAVVVLAGTTLSESPEPAWLRRPALLLLGLLTLQFALGTGAYLARFTAMREIAAPLTVLFLPTTHRIVGALMLATSVVIALRALRLGAAAGADRRAGLATATRKGRVPA
jgi:cytochrome c oxidase assembly protein subunit 15